MADGVRSSALWKALWPSWDASRANSMFGCLHGHAPECDAAWPRNCKSITDYVWVPWTVASGRQLRQRVPSGASECASECNVALGSRSRIILIACTSDPNLPCEWSFFAAPLRENVGMSTPSRSHDSILCSCILCFICHVWNGSCVHDELTLNPAADWLCAATSLSFVPPAHPAMLV